MTLCFEIYCAATPIFCSCKALTCTSCGQRKRVCVPQTYRILLLNRAGKYEVRVSTDGTTFPTATVATGTWADDATLKTARFTAVAAKAVKLTALTEAGARGPWSSAAEINVLSASGGGAGGGTTGGGTGAFEPPLPRANWVGVHPGHRCC